MTPLLLPFMVVVL